MKILVTGAAGFIGYHLCDSLLRKGYTVVGIDNINDYYDQGLKFGRLAELGINKADAETSLKKCTSSKYAATFTFVRLYLEDKENLTKLFEEEKFTVVCNLAAQAGVRYSLENPSAYVDSNIVGFVHLLECCRHHQIQHLVYASSSSVYGLNKEVPFSTKDNVDHPISLYAASKKSNELMAHTYSHLFGIPTTGLRFFTVYGPWGRPDMALFLFTDAILKNKPIDVFNHGNMERDFTYIDDIVEGVERILVEPIAKRKERSLYKIYNIGNNNTVRLTDFIASIEKKLEITAQKNMLPMQPGDVSRTWANVDELIKDYHYSPNTPIEQGVSDFIDWYKAYYNVS